MRLFGYIMDRSHSQAPPGEHGNEATSSDTQCLILITDMYTHTPVCVVDVCALF